MNTTKEDIDRLCKSVEQSIGHSLHTTKDFHQLSDRIWEHNGELLSINTLRRLWGVLSDTSAPRISTLSILARFIGYCDFAAFCGIGNSGGEASLPFLGRRLSVLDGLMPGDRLRLTWHPGRVCDVVYNGSLHFRVEASQQTRLKPGDTFLCSIIIEGLPLYLDQLQQNGSSPTTYICGRQGGVFFVCLEP